MTAETDIQQAVTGDAPVTDMTGTGPVVADDDDDAVSVQDQGIVQQILQQIEQQTIQNAAPSQNQAAPSPVIAQTIHAETDTKGTPTDPDVFAPGQAQWHLADTWGLHADQVWNDYTGEGVLVAVLDDGFQYTHHELTPNYRTDIDLDTLGGDNDPMVEGTNKHGTSVAGTIAADDNGSGSVGVTFDADIFGIRQGFGAQTDLAQTVQAFQYATAQNADVMNNSWGFAPAFSDDNGLEFVGTDFYAVRDAMEDAVENGRGGLGLNIVFSAGNARTSGENVNYHNIQNDPHVITVAAIDQDGTYSSFSNPGAALLTSAGGTQIWTTDNTGASGYGGSDYTNFSGTSASAPVVSGMVALILEANADLGWRDVQQIIAYSSQHNDAASGGWEYNGAGNWNGGGLHFSHDYGFGAADALRAVRLAETWTLQQTSANMVTTAAFSSTPVLSITDNGTVSTTINVSADIEIERVLIDLDINHTKAGDLIVTLISPDGTHSVLLNRINNGNFTTGSYGISGADFLTTSNAHRGESSAGTWTIQIQDAAGGNTGTLQSWSLQFMGHNHSTDDLYIFSDDLAGFSGGALAARSVITDTDGGTDTVNLAMVTSNSVLNLSAGTGTIAGKAVTVAVGTVIENVYGGDGDDTFTGNSANNYLFGGRGNDTLSGGAGNDTLDGDTGTDTVVYAVSYQNFTFNFVSATRVELTNSGNGLGSDILLNIENFTFTEGTFTRAALENAILNASATYAFQISNNGGGIRTYLSASDQTVTLTATDLGLGTLSGNVMSYTRSGSSLTVNYLQSAAPRDLSLDGDGTADTILITGTHSGLVATINGGGGSDTITLNAYAYQSTLHGDDGDDTVTGNAGRDTLYGDAGDDTVTGGGERDNIYGGTGDDILNGGDGADKLYGGDDDDTLNGDAGNDYLYGDAGADTVNGGDGDDIIYGGTENDTLNGDTGVDKLYGEDGADTLNGGAGNDTLDGGDGSDTLNGGADWDTLYGRAGADTLNGGTGTDYLYGGTENDTLNGGDDRDYLYGEDGDDTINGDNGSDILYGGNGTDNLYGGADGDQMYGDADNDTLSGGDGNDIMRAGTGNDVLYGDNGSDTLYGESGTNTLVGGAGQDTLYGGTGADQFGFITMGDGIDSVRNFSTAQGDTLNVTDLLTGFTVGVSDISLFVRATTTAGNTMLAVNADGVGSDFINVASIVSSGFTGQTAQTLYDANVLIVNSNLL